MPTISVYVKDEIYAKLLKRDSKPARAVQMIIENYFEEGKGK